MNSKKYEDLIAAYETDVDFPGVSGMEHLDMLITRSKIARGEDFLTDMQKTRLALADNKLLQTSGQFYDAIRSVADLSDWRQTHKIPADEWWWYLDVIAQLPTNSVKAANSRQI